MKFSADEIASVIQQEIDQFDSQVDVREVGTVLEVGDGIARVHGLTGVAAGEMVEFPGGVIGLAFNLEENSVGVIILGDYLTIEEGDEVKSLGTLLSVPAGDAVVRCRAGWLADARSDNRPVGRFPPNNEAFALNVPPADLRDTGVLARRWVLLEDERAAEVTLGFEDCTVGFFAAVCVLGLL